MHVCTYSFTLILYVFDHQSILATGFATLASPNFERRIGIFLTGFLKERQ